MFLKYIKDNLKIDILQECVRVERYQRFGSKDGGGILKYEQNGLNFFLQSLSFRGGLFSFNLKIKVIIDFKNYGFRNCVLYFQNQIEYGEGGEGKDKGMWEGMGVRGREGGKKQEINFILQRDGWSLKRRK